MPVSSSMTTSGCVPEHDRGFVELARLNLAIDRENEPGLGCERGGAARFDRSDDLIRHHDVADAAGSHDLGFAELGAGDADGACRDFQMSDRWRFIGFAVRAPVRPARFDVAGHVGDVALEGIEVDEQRGSIELFDGQADQGCEHCETDPFGLW